MISEYHGVSLSQIPLDTQTTDQVRDSKGPATKSGISYQLGQTPLGEDPAWAVDVEVSRTPAPHVEPLHSPGRERPILLVEQDQLLLGSHCGVLQHPLQLQQLWTPKEKAVSPGCSSLSVKYIHTHPYSHLNPTLHTQNPQT